MWSASCLPHMDDVSVSPTNGKWAHTRTEKNSDQSGNWTHDVRVRSRLLYRNPSLYLYMFIAVNIFSSHGPLPSDLEAQSV